MLATLCSYDLFLRAALTPGVGVPAGGCPRAGQTQYLSKLSDLGEVPGLAQVGGMDFSPSIVSNTVQRI